MAGSDHFVTSIPSLERELVGGGLRRAASGKIRLMPHLSKV